MYDLISIGDTVIDTFIPLTDAEVDVVKGERKLLLRYGDKIPVENSISMVAGNAANNAVGASRLKLKTAIYTNDGGKDDDKADLRIKSKFKEEGVDTRYVVENPDLPSNHHVVLDFKGERTILIHHQPWKFNLPDLDKSRWVYLTSMSPSYTQSNVVDQIINYAERNSVKLAYQPGTFQIKQGVKKQSRLLSLTEIIFVNLEEAKILLGHEIGESIPIKKLLKGLADLGPRLVVITDGGEGSFGFDGEKYFSLGVFPAKLIEMTGSGDGFATATMAGLFYGNDLSEAMRWGAANGASVVEQIGPQRGLLTYNQMMSKLKENSKIVAKEI
jgi:sugar/nucleoside kinase (ribokinase family)